MSYVFDTGILIQLFNSYYADVFPTLWQKFDLLIADGTITSVREVLREVNNGRDQTLKDWAAGCSSFFTTPTLEEAAFVGRIFSVKHFQQNISQQNLLKGGQIADPFVIAKAGANGSTVVTTEVFKPHSAKIPFICQHFGVPCLNLQGFMQAEGWSF